MKRIFDIETAPNMLSTDYYAKKVYKAPSNYKDQEKIDSYAETARKKDMEKAALHWWSGMVTCIGVSDFNGNAKCFSFCDRKLDGFTDFDIEKQILIEFFTYCEENPGIVLIGKSSKDFDYPFLIGRALAHDIGIPQALRRVEKDIIDVDNIFSFSRSCGQVSNLNNYAFGLGIDAKGGTGADAPILFKQGMYDKLDEYCCGDLRITVEMMKRYEKIFTGGYNNDRG